MSDVIAMLIVFRDMTSTDLRYRPSFKRLREFKRRQYVFVFSGDVKAPKPYGAMEIAFLITRKLTYTSENR